MTCADADKKQIYVKHSLGAVTKKVYMYVAFNSERYGVRASEKTSSQTVVTSENLEFLPFPRKYSLYKLFYPGHFYSNPLPLSINFDENLWWAILLSTLRD